MDVPTQAGTEIQGCRRGLDHSDHSDHSIRGPRSQVFREGQALALHRYRSSGTIDDKSRQYS
jgi:hypothetical protein